jgi:lipopolysaccharide export system protein LptA
MLPSLNLLPAICLLLLSRPCLAEYADRNKPLQLDADQVVIDDARQISTFTGNVRITQGTMQLAGDKVVVTQSKDGYTVATITGRAASFRQKREGLDEYVEGSGQRIVYDTRTETLDLYTQAHIRRDQDDVRGEHISYNVKSEIFQVSGGGQTVDGTSRRVRAVLQPRPSKPAPTNSDAAPIQ